MRAAAPGPPRAGRQRREGNRRRLLLALGVQAAFGAVELSGGLLTNSLALLRAERRRHLRAPVAGHEPVHTGGSPGLSPREG